ncbi:MAG: hypothetical protein KG003_10740 [Bacteroidetes bacterium]|nr:hypothetical protein [Bacteroidota bacterium]
MRRSIFIALFFLGFGSAHASWAPRDSVRYALYANSPGFRVGLDGRNSFLNGHAVRVGGLRFGFDYKKIGVYTGYYNTNFVEFGATDTIHTGFGYVSSTLEYSLYRTWRFEVVNTYQIGLGNAFDRRISGTDVTRNFQGVVVPVEAGLSGTVRFLRYFGFCAGFGIRLSPFNSYGFTGTYYSFGLTFFTGTMYRDAKKLYHKLKRE